MNGPALSVVQEESAPSLLPDRPQVLSACFRSVTCASTTRMLSIFSVSVPLTSTSGPSLAAPNTAREPSVAAPAFDSDVETENETVAVVAPEGDVLSPQAMKMSAAAGASRYRGDEHTSELQS